MDRAQCKRLVWLSFVLGLCSHSAAAESLLPPQQPSAAAPTDYPACHTGLRLQALFHDVKHAERSFAVIDAGVTQRPQTYRIGARVAGYELTQIAQGAVVLTQQAKPCSVRLRGAPIDRELRTIPVATVRSQLRAYKAARTAGNDRALAAMLEPRVAP